MERMVLMTKACSILAALVLLLCLAGAACAQSANPHAAEWLDEAMAASLNSR